MRVQEYWSQNEDSRISVFPLLGGVPYDTGSTTMVEDSGIRVLSLVFCNRGSIGRHLDLRFYKKGSGRDLL